MSRMESRSWLIWFEPLRKYPHEHTRSVKILPVENACYRIAKVDAFFSRDSRVVRSRNRARAVLQDEFSSLCMCKIIRLATSVMVGFPCSWVSLAKQCERVQENRRDYEQHGIDQSLVYQLL